MRPELVGYLLLILLAGKTDQAGLRKSMPFEGNPNLCLEYEFHEGFSRCSKCQIGYILNQDENICVSEKGTIEMPGSLHKTTESEKARFLEMSEKQPLLTPDVRYNKIASQPFLSGHSTKGGSKYTAGSDVPNMLGTLGDKILGEINYHHEEPSHMYDLPPVVELGTLTAQIAAGGRMAKKALIRLNTLANHVGMDKYIRSFLPIALACKSLYIREQEDVNVKMLCGSLFSRITNTPVTSQYADIANGTDYGKVSTIVMPRPSRLYRPDKEVQKLREGADLEHILDDKPLEYYE